MEALKQYLLKNFEQAFVLLVLLSVVGIYYFAPFKLAFLNFFFIPILMAGYYLGMRYAVLGAFLCVTLVIVYLAIDPTPFLSLPDRQSVFLQVSLWGGFLIISGALVGRLYENLDARIQNEKKINEAYQQTQVELEEANQKLKDYAENLESMVEEKTQHLSATNKVVEQLKNRVEEVLYSSMDPTVAKLLIEKKLRTEKKHISVLVSDLQGFTPYVENKRPESVIHELNKYLKDMSVFVDVYSAHLDRFTGDGFTLEFGAPIDYKYHALQAVVCGVSMMEFMRESAYPWKVRLAITSGSAVVGMIGGRKRAYTAMGDCANTASRLEALCPPGSLLIDEETYNATKDFIEVQVFHTNGQNGGSGLSHIKSEIIKLKQELEKQPGDAGIMMQLAHKLMQIGEFQMAKDWFSKVMEVDPNRNEAKIDYAEASMHSGNDLIKLKGRSNGFVLYEVIGMRNFLDTPAIPASIRDQYSHVIAKNSIPMELIWPVEIISGELGHAARTTLLAYALADQLNIGARERQALVTAGFLHNIGHQIVPHSVLTKATRLTQEDIQSIQRHPEESVRLMLRHGYDDRMALECVVNHHQTPSNTGYPNRSDVKGVSKIARILSIAEVYESLTEDRPWRDRWNPESALEEMRMDAVNGKFDAEIFEAFEEMILSGFRD